MNLTNFEKTPIHLVQEMVRREAARFGLSITKAELVGLIPRAALLNSARWYLQLDDMRDDQVLEYRLDQELAADITPARFIEATAAGTPTPGGGAVAALAGALGASLTQMVAGLTVGRRKYAEVEQPVQEVLATAAAIGAQLTEAISLDAAAFEAVMAAYRDKTLDETARAAAIEQTTIRAGEVPLEVARLSLEVAQLARTLVQLGNINAVTDAAAAAIMAQAAVQAAGLNIRVNAVSLQNQELAQAWKSEVDSLESKAAALVETVRITAAERGGFAI